MCESDSGAPICLENVDANFSLAVDVAVVDSGSKLDLRVGRSERRGQKGDWAQWGSRRFEKEGSVPLAHEKGNLRESGCLTGTCHPHMESSQVLATC